LADKIKEAFKQKFLIPYKMQQQKTIKVGDASLNNWPQLNHFTA
jgi:hypothetical protein